MLVANSSGWLVVGARPGTCLQVRTPGFLSLHQKQAKIRCYSPSYLRCQLPLSLDSTGLNLSGWGRSPSTQCQLTVTIQVQTEVDLSDTEDGDNSTSRTN